MLVPGLDQPLLTNEFYENNGMGLSLHSGWLGMKTCNVHVCHLAVYLTLWKCCARGSSSKRCIPYQLTVKGTVHMLEEHETAYMLCFMRSITPLGSKTAGNGF